MSKSKHLNLRRVLIVSSHPLFGKGMRTLLETYQRKQVEVISMVSNVEDALRVLIESQPNLVILDYDDEAVNREEFLARFVESENQMRVVLLSLKEGGSNAIIYDRRNLEASHMEEWLQEWTVSPPTNRKRNQSVGTGTGK